MRPQFNVIWTLNSLDFQVVEILEARMKAGVARKPVSDAMNAIDLQLDNDPANVGESREEGVRGFSVRPLTVYFKIFPVERVVHVLDVHDFEHKPS